MYAGYVAVTGDVDSTLKVLTGWNFTETAGSAAEVYIRDGSASGTIVVDIKLGAGESAGESYYHPLMCQGASKFYIDVASGTVRGAVYGG